MCTLSGGDGFTDSVVGKDRTIDSKTQRRVGLFRSVMCSPLEEIGVEIGETKKGS